MVIEFRGVAGDGVNGEPSVTVIPHADTRNGDLMIALQVVGGGILPAAIPAGWTRLRPQLHYATGGNRYGELLYKFAEDEDFDNGYQFAAVGDTDIAAAIATYEVVHSTAPVDVDGETENTPSTSHTAPAVTATLDSGLLVCAYAIWGVSGSVIVPAGMTERADFSAGGVDASVYICDKQLAAAGSTGAQVATSGNAHESIGVAIVLDTVLAQPGSIPPRLVEGGLKFGLD